VSADLIRIKYILPRPLDEDGIARRAAQIPVDALAETTRVDCAPVATMTTGLDSYYESFLLDAYVLQAGLRAEEEGYHAVVMDTVSDAALYTLRARLRIPVVGPGIAAYLYAVLLGKRFSVVTMIESWRWFYERNLDAYGLRQHCVSIRALGLEPDTDRLFEGKETEAFARLLDLSNECIERDGADVIMLGSTTMHEAGAFLSSRVSVPVINPGPLALKVAENLVQLNLTHSLKAFPLPRVGEEETSATAPWSVSDG
jgi:allantoin racemase